VAGLVALVRAAYPDLDAANVINRIISTATPAGDQATFGYGLINAAGAVTADVATVTSNPLGDLEAWVKMYRRAPATAMPVPTITSSPLPLPDRGFVFSGPTQFEVTQVAVPLAFALGFAILITLGSIGVARRYVVPRDSRDDESSTSTN
jgi:hypothetical protein